VGLCLPGSGALGHRHCLGDAYRLGESSARVGREDDLLPLARDALDIAYRVQPAQLALNVGKEATTNDRDRIADVGARRAENNLGIGCRFAVRWWQGIDTGDLNRPDANSVLRWVSKQLRIGQRRHIGLHTAPIAEEPAEANVYDAKGNGVDDQRPKQQRKGEPRLPALGQTIAIPDIPEPESRHRQVEHRRLPPGHEGQ